MDDLQFYILFNSISVIYGRIREGVEEAGGGGEERMTMKDCVQLGREQG